MTKIVLLWAFSVLVIQLVSSASLRELRGFTASTPTKVANVQDGSLLYLSSNDDIDALSKITISSNGKTTNLQQILANVDSDEFQLGWAVNSDLTISTTNTAIVTDNLYGTLFISSPEMAKDPNFLVYVVKDQAKTIDRLDKPETTLLLLNLRVNKGPDDAVYKPFYHTTVKNIVQPTTTKLNFYSGYPDDGYTDPTYKETLAKNVFQNPKDLIKTGNSDSSSYFFKNIEPVQFTKRNWYIRATGGIKLDVSQDWQDQSKYQTTNETTTGLTMNQLFTYNSTINFRHNQNRVVTSGWMVSTELFADMNISMCSDVSCQVWNAQEEQNLNRYYQEYNLDVTSLYVEPSTPVTGLFYIQYFRIEGDVSSTNPATVPTATTPSIDTTTKLNSFLTAVDGYAFQYGVSVNSNVTISTTNTEEITSALTGYLFIATPTMAQDPNFSVYAVRGSNVPLQPRNENSTIVLLNSHATSTGAPPYAGFTHTRVENISQPRTTFLSFYSGEPDDNYGDLDNEDTINKRIFSNPVTVTNEDGGVAYFFDNIDPIQYGLQLWVFSSRGNFTMKISDTYVDTTSITSNATSTTGMSNSQLFTQNSTVTFLPSGDNLGMSGIVVSTELFANNNITIRVNGEKGRTLQFLESEVNDRNTLASVEWPADNIQIWPSSQFAGNYFIQYFKIDNGPAPTTNAPTTTQTPAPTKPATTGSVTTQAPVTSTTSSNGPTSATSTSSRFSSSMVSVSSTTQEVQTTTKSVAMSFMTLPIILAFLHSLMHV